MSGPAVGGLLFTLPLMGVLARWKGAPLVYVFTLAMLMGFIVLVGMIRTPMVCGEKKAFSVRDNAGGV